LWTHEIIDVFRDWLEDPEVLFVGHNLTDTDYHAMANGSVEVAGVLADTLKLSKLVHNAWRQPHGLKHHLEFTFGYQEGNIKELFSRPKGGAKKTAEKLKKGKRKCGPYEKVPTITWGDYQNVCWKTMVLIPFSDIVPGHTRWVRMVDYASLDAKACLELYHYLWPRIEKMRLDKYYKRIDHPRLRVLTGMEQVGWKLDQEKVRELLAKLYERRSELEDDLRGWGQVTDLEDNPAVPHTGSDPHMQHLLYGDGTIDVAAFRVTGLGLRVSPVAGNMASITKTKRGQKPRSAAALIYLANDKNTPEEHRPYILKLNEYNKLVNNIGKMERFSAAAAEEPDGRLRYQLQAMTDTGRLSARNQPIQQVPKPENGPMREIFIAEPGKKLVVADFAGLEMRVLSHFLFKVFGDESLKADVESADIHSSVAKKVWVVELEGTPDDLRELKGGPKSYLAKRRSTAKIVIYALNYGKTALGLGIQILDEEGRPVGTERAQEILDSIISLYPLEEWWEYLYDTAAADNWQVKTILGRPRILPGLAFDKNNKKEKWKYFEDERRLKNTVIQGTAADVVDMAMLKCNTFDHPDLRKEGWVNDTLKNLDCVMLAQVHDELVFEVPEENAEEALAEITRCMESALPLLIPTPVDAHIVDNWGEAK